MLSRIGAGLVLLLLVPLAYSKEKLYNGDEFILQAITAPMPIPDAFDLLVGPGAVIIQNANSSSKNLMPFITEFSGTSRALAAAVVSFLSSSQYNIAPVPILFTGGYNIGVRYLSNGTIIPANLSIAAQASARTFASEAQVKSCPHANHHMQIKFYSL